MPLPSLLRPFKTLPFNVILTCAALFTQPGWAAEDVSRHTKIQVNGWTVMVSPELNSAPQIRDAMLRKIKAQTAFIVANVPAKHVKVMRKSDFWLEPDTHWRSLARYHSTKTAMLQEGISEAKYRDVEIFVNFARLNHKTLVLHELAHTFHDRKLSNKYRKIKRLYDKFEASAPNAKDRCGRQVKAYALKNPNEFFATFTEAYFGKSCSYPYDRATIQKSHPEIFAFLAKTWGG